MTIYLIDTDGGCAVAKGPRAQAYADAMMLLGWRVATKDEYTQAKKRQKVADKKAEASDD